MGNESDAKSDPFGAYYKVIKAKMVIMIKQKKKKETVVTAGFQVL